MDASGRAVDRAGLFSGAPVRVAWGAILGGALVAIGLWVLLYAFGVAAGLSPIDPFNPSSARGAGIGTGVWALVAPLVALFVGGAVASRGAGLTDGVGGVIHGAIVWSVTSLAGLLVIGAVVGSLLAGSASLARAGDATGLDLLGSVNRRLRDEGKAEVSPLQLRSATIDVLARSVRDGRLDKDALIAALEMGTRLSHPGATQVVREFEPAWTTRLERAHPGGRLALLRPAQVTRRVFWGVSGSMLLGLISSVLGASIGVRKRRRISVPREAPHELPHELPHGAA